jgi:hypothetical protein
MSNRALAFAIVLACAPAAWAQKTTLTVADASVRRVGNLA